MYNSGLSKDEVAAAKEAKNQLARLIQQRQEKFKLLQGTTKPDESRTSRKPPYHIPPEVDTFPHYRAEHDPKNFDKMMQDHRRQFARKQDDNAVRLRELNITRAHMLDERKRIIGLREKVIRRPISPLYEDGGGKDRVTDAWEHIRRRPDPATVGLGWQSPGGQPVQEIIVDTKSKLPKIEERFQAIYKHHQEKKRLMSIPYDGSLDKKSYEPWQLPHYDICRTIIENEVMKLLEKLVPIDGKDYVKERDALDIEIDQMVKQKVTQLLNEELVYEVTLEESEATAEEYLYLSNLAINMADQACILESEVFATRKAQGRDQDDPVRQDVTDNFYKSQRLRNDQNLDVWQHSQHLIIKDPTESELREQETAEADVDTVEYDTLPPAQLKHIAPKQTDEHDEEMACIVKKNYWDHEVKYWKNFDTENQILTLPKKATTITAVAYSPNGLNVAIGTKSGLILIYQIDISMKPPFRLHLVSPQAPGAPSNQSSTVEDPVVNLSWSLDNIRFTSVTLNGVLGIWSINNWKIGNREIVDSSLKESNSKYLPGALICEFKMIKLRQDFLFQSENEEHLESYDRSWGPKFAIFMPAFSLIGTVPIICVGMTNNDFLRIDTEKAIERQGNLTARRADDKPADTTEDNVFLQKRELFKTNYDNVQGDPVPLHQLQSFNTGVDWFRGHKHPIIFMHFRNNFDEIVTADDQGYVLVWRYNSNQLSRGQSYWFEPMFRGRISMKIEMFEVNDYEEPHIHYNILDENSTFNTAEDLRNAEHELAYGNFRHPLYKFEDPKKNFSTYIYRNVDEQTTESGAILHEVSRLLDTNRLILYSTRVYQSFFHYADAFLGCAINSEGTRLTSLILYPADPPIRDPWIEVINFDILNLKACEPRIQIDIKAAEYKEILEQGTIFFNVTPPLKPMGAEYLVVNILGKTYVYSLLTGQKVVKTIPRVVLGTKKKFLGLEMTQANFNLRPDSEIFFTMVKGQMLMFSYSRGSNYLNLTLFKNQNTRESTSKMADVSRELAKIDEKFRDFPLPAKDKSAGAFYLSLPENLEAIVRYWLYEAMESAMEEVNGPLPLSMSKKFMLDDRKRAYDMVQLPKAATYPEKNAKEASAEKKEVEQKDNEDEEIVEQPATRMPDFMD